MLIRNECIVCFPALGVDMERHSTPTPEMPLFTSGVQEPPLLQGITIPALYAAAYESLVLRSILNHLATETFRKGWHWKPKFVSKCRECDETYQKEVETCLKWVVKSDQPIKANMNMLTHY